MANKRKYKIIFTGGGTGGHIFPLISIIRELKQLLPADVLDVHYVGPKDFLSLEYMKKEGVNVKYVSTGKIRRYGGVKATFQNFLDICFRIPLGILQSFVHVYILSPDLVFSKGGHGSFPVVLMARVFQVPIFTHESDAVLGSVNKLLQGFFSEIFLSFPKTEGADSSKVIVVGNPVRKEIISEDKEEGREAHKIITEDPVLFILGGSQGSERINDLLLSSITGLLQDFEIIHQCGENNYKEVSAEVAAVVTDENLRKKYHPYPFLNEKELKFAYACGDLVISRAGSGSVFEIAINAKAAIFLPLPEAAQNHQVKNAYQYSASGSSIVLEEDNLSSNFFQGKIKELFSPIKQIRNMEANAKKFSRPRAGLIIASYIKEYLTR